MNMLILLIIIIVLSFGIVGGLFILLKKESDHVGDDEAVPITDINEIKKEFGNLTSDLSGESASLGTHSNQAAIGDPRIFDKDGFNPKKELKGVEKEVHDAVVSHKIEPINTAQDTLVSSKNSFDEQYYKDRISKLESDLKEMSGKTLGQVQEAMDTISDLRDENEQLRDELKTIADGKNENASEVVDGDLQKKMHELQKENEHLKSQLSEGSEKITWMQAQADVIKKELGSQLVQANKTIDRLENEAQSIKESFSGAGEVSLIDDLKKKVIELTEKLSKAEEEMKRLHAVIKRLEKSESEVNKKEHDLSSEEQLKGLLEMNSNLVERINRLQYEVTKNRAQISGLEKMCENYKKQLSEKLSGNSNGSKIVA